jgi:translation initiation factor 2B subunit (eIF-2B alpha/beta/delta family)
MKIRLAGYKEDKSILVHWFMDLKNENELLSFNETKRAKEQDRLRDKIISNMPFLNNSFMIVCFNIVNSMLFLNEYETFKYKYQEEAAYMGSKENLNQYVRDYFSDDNIQLMLKTIIASDKTKIEDKENLAKFLINNDKHIDIEEETPKEKINEYYRYNITKDENETLTAGMRYLVAILGKNLNQDSSKKIIDLKNILNKVKHIKLSDKKINATSKARSLNIEKSRKKIEKAYLKLIKQGKKITIYSISKEAKVAYPTAKKYLEIYEDNLSN